ncbi:MAG: hypothetical protein R3350_05045 [Saprospiraceae bacterium]|nr:hypothetical protein [Saprospiraceae bacterium]
MRVSKILWLFIISALLASCVTRKKKEDISFLGKLYHNTTAKYNGYFNANELMEASIVSLEEQYQDNYQEILPIFEVTATDNPQSVAADLDEAIKKVSVVVNLHRVSQWTDDCYLLLGKAQYLKQDYESAEETLRYLLTEFDPEKLAMEKRVEERARELKKEEGAEELSDDRDELVERIQNEGLSPKEKRRLEKKQEKARERYNKLVKKNRRRRAKGKKPLPLPRQRNEEPEPEELSADTVQVAEQPPAPAEEELPTVSIADEEPASEEAQDGGPNYFMKHRPAYQEGVLWLARTLIERDKFSQAQRLIDQLEGDPGTFAEVRRQLAPTQAYLFTSQEEYDNALPALQRSIQLANRREDKARYAYITAQIHELAGRGSEATAAYEEALKYAPAYEMEFGARLNLAKSGLTSTGSSATAALQDLEKMLKDIKNEEYQDRIYYAMADIALKSGDRQEGIEYLRSSLRYSRQNNPQKTKSYLTLARLYFEEEEFVAAKNYFDSTLQTMAESDERYVEIQRLSNNLTGIAEMIQVIEYQDSLLTVAELSEEERKELAFRILQEQEQKRIDEISRKSGTSGNQNPQVARAVSLGAASANESSFFAYDDRAVKRGEREFSREWGDRPLEDDWRRSSKQGLSEIDVEEAAEDIRAQQRSERWP